MLRTIQNCWAKSQAIDFGARPLLPIDWQETSSVIISLQADIQRLQDIGHIQEVMNIHQFIDPIQEQVIEDVDTIIDSIVTRQSPEILTDNDEELQEEVPIVKENEALMAIQILRRYEEQQVDGDPDFLRVLGVQGRKIEYRRVRGLGQRDLRSWFHS
ncbi:hypothetical protein B7463_g11901, partial [Scytalidium lignicola]